MIITNSAIFEQTPLWLPTLHRLGIRAIKAFLASSQKLPSAFFAPRYELELVDALIGQMILPG
jgi:hypothetical protein